MKKIAIFILILALILVAIMSFTISSKSNYIRIPEYTRSHTKAICDSENFCQDYEIFCKNQEVISMSPITGAVVQFSKNWQDPRTPKLRNEFC